MQTTDIDKMRTRFYDRVVASDEDSCWLWVGGTTGSSRFPYGLMPRGVGEKNVRAHRASYEIHHGPIPEGMFVCHSCDNPSCVNPFHLFVGSAEDNVHDMMSKGRDGSVGERHHCAKLTEEDVAEIRSRLARGEARLDLAHEFNVSKATIRNIHSRKTWRHLP